MRQDTNTEDPASTGAEGSVGKELKHSMKHLRICLDLV